MPLPNALARRILVRSEGAALGTLAGDIQAGVNLDNEQEEAYLASCRMVKGVGATMAGDAASDCDRARAGE